MLAGFYDEHKTENRSKKFEHGCSKTQDSSGWEHALGEYQKERAQKREDRIKAITENPQYDDVTRAKKLQDAGEYDENPVQPGYTTLSSGNFSGAQMMSIFNEACQKNHLRQEMIIEVEGKDPENPEQQRAINKGE